MRQRAGLGDEFFSAFDATVERIRDKPVAFAVVRGTTRRALLRRFPYVVYFRFDGVQIVVSACVHVKRHPRAWVRR